jgi:hypothetical protein
VVLLLSLQALSIGLGQLPGGNKIFFILFTLLLDVAYSLKEAIDVLLGDGLEVI